MKGKAILAFVIVAAALTVTVAVLHSPNRSPEPSLADADLSGKGPEPAPEPSVSEAVSAPIRSSPPAGESVRSPTPAEEPAVATNKLERLVQVRETFRALASGPPVAALQAAKLIRDETERETALITLVTEWTQGELSPPRQRARAIAVYGLEAGLGLELAKNPELAALWASELTDGVGQVAVLQRAAMAAIDSDPAAAFALSDRLPEGNRRTFLDSVFTGWAARDTGAALQWADQLADSAERDAATQAIRTVAPVGIGAALSMQEGYPVIKELLPGTPAELGGQLQAGDRILAIAQGVDAFVDTRNLSLQEVVQMIRGEPGTQIQLQILPGNASADSPPRTISIIRDQIKFKR